VIDFIGELNKTAIWFDIINSLREVLEKKGMNVSG